MAVPSKSSKILVVGSAMGSISELFGKVESMNQKHGPFDFALCIGDLFGSVPTQDEQLVALLQGQVRVPIACYVMQGEHAMPPSVLDKFAKAGGELCPNVFLLAKSGVLTTAQGVRIASLGGVYNSQIYHSAPADAPFGFDSPYFTKYTVEKIISNSFITNQAQATKGVPSKQKNSLASIMHNASSSHTIDILISNDWPTVVTNYSSQPLPSPELLKIGAPPVDEVVRRLKPRYHFAARGGSSPVFWEREPFVWDDEGGRVSRFLSLGAFGGPTPVEGKKPRWFYAFSISPSSSASDTSAPKGATKNPFMHALPRLPKRPVEDDEGQNFIFGDAARKRARTGYETKAIEPHRTITCPKCDTNEHTFDDCPVRERPPEGYICKTCNISGHFVRDCPRKFEKGDTGGKRPRPGYICRACGSELHFIDDCPSQKAARQAPRLRESQKPISPDECWFCLSNPNLAKHLIVSIGEECYVSLPKGQIIPTSDHANPLVPGGGHVLIIPVDHHPIYNAISHEIAPNVLAETEKYKSALRSMYAKHHASAVIFDVAVIRGKGGHAHLQVVPIPQSITGEQVDKAFREIGLSQNVVFEPEERLEEAEKLLGLGQQGYFKVELPNGRVLLHLIHSPGFNLQFGRQVLVTLLNMPDRYSWKSCVVDEAEELADAAAFKEAFTPFEPSD